MACLRDQSGKVLCQIFEHPDLPNQSFCSTCGNRFNRYAPTTTSEPASRKSVPPMLTELIVGVLLLLIAAGINSLGKNINSSTIDPLPQPPMHSNNLQ